MNAGLIARAELILKDLALRNLKKDEISQKFNLSEEEVRQILKYLKDKGAVDYISTFGSGLSGILNLEVTSKGCEVALNKRKLIETSETSFQQLNVHAPVQNLSQVQGDGATITQSIDNSQYNVLKHMIENDDELEQEKKNSLLDILDKFNKMKETGENALDLIKKVGSIAMKYVPYFFALLK